MRINEQIRVPEVRLIGPEGEQIGVMATREALAQAAEVHLDLVEVAPQASPPVCRIMDYGKFKYQQNKRTHDAKKNQTVSQIKEIKVRPKTDEHDISFKIKHIRRFLEDGDKVKVTMVFRGREIAHAEIAMELMNRIIKETEDIGVVQKTPVFEGRNMFMIIGGKTQKS